MVQLSLEAFKSMIAETADKFPYETGGILMGSRQGRKMIIHYACGPGPQAKHGRASFTPDDLFHEKEMERIYYDNKREITYLGDWHTHPNSSAYLSERDKKTLKEIAAYPPSQLPDPFMLVIGTNPFQIKIWHYAKNRMIPGKLIRKLRLEIDLGKI